ncbi:MAG: ABC transporter ATP-binding protein [Dehalococcoidia bacterium]|nr:MAG: ABC transporter ATP-binding protein [Dehalococcoidia bacterium]|tara:strand:+ start:293 stop:1306 length:1014 start_codon:yes stop_codon:yes gene_type:complete
MSAVLNKKESSVLNVEGLTVDFDVKGKSVNILSEISFDLKSGETLGIIGESGCGKSMTALALLRMIPSPPGRITAGKVLLNDENLLTATKNRINSIRGKEISMIFQEPMSSLNPVYTVGNQIVETIRRHKLISSPKALEEAVELLRMVQIPAPDRRINEYPHQLSGGMRQRVMIAMALACSPKVLIADEPTTALDVTVQAQIFDLLKEIQEKNGTSIILITHDFSAVTEMADRVLVMYAGHKIEEGTLGQITNDAKHPYTRGLLQSMPEIKSDPNEYREPLPEIPGAVPDLINRQEGCPFGPRCSFAMSKCLEMPQSYALGENRSVKCWLAQQENAA